VIVLASDVLDVAFRTERDAGCDLVPDLAQVERHNVGDDPERNERRRHPDDPDDHPISRPYVSPH
jgi:hypothetical protein